MTQITITEFLTQSAIKTANQAVRALVVEADADQRPLDYEEEDCYWRTCADEVEWAKLWS